MLRSVLPGEGPATSVRGPGSGSLQNRGYHRFGQPVGPALLLGQLRFQLVAQGHQPIDFGDNPVLLAKWGERDWKLRKIVG